MTTTAVMVATSPASLPVQKVTEYTVFGGMPFQMVEGIAYQNNYISAIGPTYPNHGNQSQSTTSNPSELWQTAFNDSSPWLWSWSPMLGLDPNITTVPNTLSQNTTLNTTTYTALNVKHSKLQIDANMVFMVSPGAMTIDVLSYYHISPRKTYARDFPPRSIPFPANVTSITHISHLDTNFGVYAVTNSRSVHYIPSQTPIPRHSPHRTVLYPSWVISQVP
ncbi:hypothetical protein BC829DRAFT_26829 [Chytridium lagenaria]|nr:hypothetical protein BC829DRAFT_26829 [Chytridium lagenaria]